MNVKARTPGPAIVKSADRTIDLLEFLAEVTEPPSFGQIARDLAIPKSSLSQLLANLLARNYVELDRDAGTYRLGGKMAELGRRALAQVPFEQVLRAAMERLRDQINETVAFHLRRGDETEVAAAVTARHALVYTMTIGDRAPLYAMSAGKIFLSAMPKDEFDRYLKRTRLEKLAPNTFVSKAALRREVEQVRRNRMALACEELAQGIRGMAVPIAVGDRLIGALNVAVPIARYDARLEAAIRVRLPSTAHELATALGRYDPKALP